MTKSLMQEAYEKEQLRMAGGGLKPNMLNHVWDVHCHYLATQSRDPPDATTAKQIHDAYDLALQGVTTVIVPAPTANNVKYFTRISLADVGGAKQGVWHVVWDECSALSLANPSPEQTCECGSGSNAIGSGHSDWCCRYLVGG